MGAKGKPREDSATVYGLRFKMIAIDGLVHAFHGDYQGERARLRRTACISVLEGSDEELKKMLEDLAYGDNVDSRMRETKIEWRRKKAEARKAKADYR
jgi:hypothetical protein